MTRNIFFKKKEDTEKIFNNKIIAEVV